MRTRTRTALAAITLVGALTLSACTGDDGDDSGGSGSEQAGGGAADPGAANAPAGTMAEKTIATPHGDDASGGEVTVTLRSVEAGPENMTVRWALRWDDDEVPADEGVSYADMGISPITTVTDRAALKAYRPYCTRGAWQPGDDVEFPGNERAFCEDSMLVSPLDDVTFDFPNHGTIEAWAILPAPDGNPKTVDVAPAEGLPMFTDATVTYLDGASDGGDE